MDKKQIKLTYRRANILFLSLFIFAVQCIYAQQTGDANSRTVTGTVIDTNNEPIMGALVTVKGTALGAVTGMDGTYILNNVPGNGILIVSFMGYVKQEIPINNRNQIDAVLEEDNLIINEVVIVGYGTQKKVSLTGAVSSVNNAVLKQSPVANISNALAGKLTGVITVQNSGEPGWDGANIWIRGQGTYQSVSQGPLIIVDGIERAFGDIDPNEIENISVMKDASSTAVYGVRGANGVVIVTTKRGSEGKPRVSANIQHALTTPTRMPEYLDSYDALLLYREGLKNDGLNYAVYTDEYINKFKDRSNPTYQYLYPNVNWQDELLKDIAHQTQANINVSGGSGSVRYFISASYMNQGGIYNRSEREDHSVQIRTERYNFRSNIDVDINKYIKMELNLGAIILDKNTPGSSAGEIFTSIQKTPSWWYPMINPDGTTGESINKDPSPYALLTQRGYSRHHSTTLNSTLGFGFDMSFITKGLSSKVRISFDNNNYRNVGRTHGYKAYSFTIDENETDLTKGTYTITKDQDTTPAYNVTANGSRTANLEAFLNYDRQFGRHQVGALFLYNQQQRTADVGGGSANAIAGLPYRRQGLVGRITYNLDRKYYLEVNAGYNGSENFPKGKRFGLFPAISASWVASEESFIKDNAPVIDLLKLRGSFGVVGNDKIGGNRFLYLSTWNTDMYGYYFGYIRDGWQLRGVEVTATGNPDITWEKARKTNIGIDLGLWNAFRFTADVFYEYRTDILTEPLTIPDLAGVTRKPNINAGIVENRGFEVEAEYRKQFKDYGYFVKGNYSFARNKIIDITEPDYVGREWQEKEGTRIGDMWGLTAIGLFQSQEEIDNSPEQKFGAVQPGDIKYKDLNGDDVIDDLDKGFLNKVEKPESVFGFSLGGNYKNFDLSIMFQGTGGGHVWATGDILYPFARFSNILADVKGNYWSAENTPEQNKHVKYPRMVSDSNANNYQNSNFWLRSTNYLRLKNVEVGYTLPHKFCHMMGINHARIYFTGENLLTWDDMKIFDPEMPNGSGNYPQQKIFNFGLNVNF